MKRLLWVSMALAPLLVQPAAAQTESREAIALQNQKLELQHERDTLQVQQPVPLAPPPGYYAAPAPQSPYYAPAPQGPTYLGPQPPAAGDIVPQLLNRVNNLEEEVRDLRGRIDELQNTLQQTTADLGKRIDDLRFQLQNKGAAASPAAPSATAAAPASSAPPPPPKPAPVASAVSPPPVETTGPRTPEVALQEGYADFNRGNYTNSEKAAQEVLAKRASPRAYDAQYLLAQSLAGQHQWSRAAIAYDDAYNRSPKGTHAESALLGLAISLTAINEKRAACETLAKLKTQFPKPKPELVPQITATAERAGCK